jgi:hypothetical protein
MRNPTVDDVVRLKRDVPYLNLRKGDTGVVRSLWFAPREAYEVEFKSVGLDDATRTVLLREQVDLAEYMGGDEQIPPPGDRYEANPSGVW